MAQMYNKTTDILMSQLTEQVNKMQVTSQAISLGASTTPPSKSDRRSDPSKVKWEDLENGDELWLNDEHHFVVTDASGNQLIEYQTKEKVNGGSFSYSHADNTLASIGYRFVPHKEEEKEETWVDLDPKTAKVGMNMRYRKDIIWEIMNIIPRNNGLHGTNYSITRARNGKIVTDVWPENESYEWKVAKEVTPKVDGVTFDSVILPTEKKQAIEHAINQVEHHNLIFTEWGFGDTMEKGKAISMLFYGEPGTGKTLMAQAIADKYSYKLVAISTGDIETPEPGGAERAIKKAFKDAGKDTVLLFDECDSLISSRKHMGSILAAQVNALLTELEQYEGIVVFTTNRIETLDEAFERRLSLKLEFEMPSAEHRAQIWSRMFPAKAPLSSDVDFTELASVEIAGGHIKNIVLQSARMAANQQIPKAQKRITQDILITALAQEVEGMNKFAEAKKDDNLYGNALSPGMRKTLIRGRGKVSNG